ncbi:MAG: hypothetical protein HYZ25_13730 [Chloroflexi bacterium]|nr:hypothetical protein [Chloroflexota bacterium]
MRRPYMLRHNAVGRGFVRANHDNPMHMIWHDHMRAQFNEREMLGDGAHIP